MKQPWEMMRKEWDAEREKAYPNTAQSNFTRNSGSQAVRRCERLAFLSYGHSDPHLHTTHRDVIEKALREGQPVPEAVRAEYAERRTPAHKGE